MRQSKKTDPPSSKPGSDSQMASGDETRPGESQAGFSEGGDEPRAEELGESPMILGGRYHVEELLGEGGMGRVYRAFDERLGRWVALKLLRPNSSATASRLLFEARSQARVDHDHVCKVYEAGEIDGQAFVAMQYIEGLPLQKAFELMTLREKVTATRQIAQGVHAAHRQGLIHRDLKPSNIMIEKNDHGTWKAYVLDFGLAREQAAPGVTTTGEVKGTPHYMSPEQVTGEIHTLDPRSDVYGLGATLYEGLSGQPLYADSSGLGVLVKVLNEEPEALRLLVPSIPVEIDTIVMKCLEKAPDKRYQSANDLAEDLRRFLDGEPVSARPASLVYRWSKRLGKRKVAVLSWLLILLVLSGVVLALLNHFRNVEQERMEALFDNDIEQIEETLQAAYTDSLHPITAQKEQVRRRLQSISDKMAELGRAARGPGNYALGRGYLALEEFVRAREHLEEAWNSGYQGPEVAYSLGRVMGALYQQELRHAERLEDNMREARRGEIERDYRRPALEFLHRSRDFKAESAEFLEALMAFWERQYEDALVKARQAYESQPWEYQTKKLEGDIYVAIGDDERRGGDYEAARQSFLLAATAYEEAQQRGRSDPQIYLGKCTLGHPLMEMAIYGTGEQPQPFFEKALASCRQALLVDPEFAEAYQLISELEWRMGEFLLFHDGDSRAHFERAITAADQTLELDSKNVYALTSKGWAYSLWGDWELQRGLDPTLKLERAAQAFRAAGEVNPNHAPSHSGLGYSFHQRAQFALRLGQEPQPTLDQAITAFKRAIAIRPRFTYAFDNLGNTHLSLALWDLRQGTDPSQNLEAARKALENALECNRQHVFAYANLSKTYRLWALYELRQGRDPASYIEKSRAAVTEGLAINVGEADLYVARGKLALLEAESRIRRGESPEAFFVEAEQSLEHAVALFSGEVEAFHAQAELQLLRMAWGGSRGQIAKSNLKRGLQDIASALAINPAQAESIALRGRLHLAEAKSEPTAGRRKAAMERARKDLDKALAMNPSLELEIRPLLEELTRL